MYIIELQQVKVCDLFARIIHSYFLLYRDFRENQAPLGAFYYLKNISLGRFEFNSSL